MSISEDIKKAQQESEAKLKEAERLTKLSELYPDLRKQVGRWNKVTYCSKSVNSIVDKYDQRHNCGCCHDSPLEIWPYIETQYGNVYSDPPCFIVGERSDFGSIACPNWEDNLKKQSIPATIIDPIKRYLDACYQLKYEDEEDIYDPDDLYNDSDDSEDLDDS